MSIRYANVINHLPETKMRLYPTKVINVIGGPGSDKSLFSAAIVLHLSLHGKTVETIPDFAKSLVWQQNFEVLKNQYFIAQRQFEMLNLIDGQVHFLITECSLPQVLFYNENYAENICDVAKTREQILEWYRLHDNINILVERSDKKYLRAGRFQDEEQARAIDRGLRDLLLREGIPFTTLAPDVDAVNAFAASLLKSGKALTGLDLGTGCGAASLGLLLLRPEQNLRLLGIDTGPEMVAAASQNVQDLGLARDGARLGLGVEYQGPRFALEVSLDTQTYAGANVIARDITVSGQTWHAQATVASTIKVTDWTGNICTKPRSVTPKYPGAAFGQTRPERCAGPAKVTHSG